MGGGGVAWQTQQDKGSERAEQQQGLVVELERDSMSAAPSATQPKKEPSAPHRKGLSPELLKTHTHRYRQMRNNRGLILTKPWTRLCWNSRDSSHTKLKEQAVLSEVTQGQNSLQKILSVCLHSNNGTSEEEGRSQTRQNRILSLISESSYCSASVTVLIRNHSQLSTNTFISLLLLMSRVHTKDTENRQLIGYQLCLLFCGCVDKLNTYCQPAASTEVGTLYGDSSWSDHCHWLLCVFIG